MSEHIIYSEATKFQEDVKESPLPVVLYFYSDDCPPCSTLDPAFDRLAKKFAGRVGFVKIKYRDSQVLAESLGVELSPTLLFFLNGQEVGRRLTGFIQKHILLRAIESILGHDEAGKEMEKPEVNCDLLILGGGPAGLAAGVYAGRARLNTTILDNDLPGGQISTAYHVANYPGTEGVIKGSELSENMIQQVRSFGVRVEDFKEIQRVSLSGGQKQVVAEDTVYLSPAVIIATGARSRKLPAEGSGEWEGRGVHYCATCDGPLYQGQDVIVVGGGNSAVEAAIFLTRFAKSVTVIHEFNHLQASKVSQEEALANSRIKFVWEGHIRRVEGNGRVTGVLVEHLPTKEKRIIPGTGVFVYIGTEPQTDLFRGQVEINSQGYIRTDGEMRTGVPGVFAAGDVRQKEIRQIATAVGDGATAAVQAERYLTQWQ